VGSRPFSTKRIKAVDLLGASLAGVPRERQLAYTTEHSGKGVSLNSRSELGEILVFFDNEMEGELLVRGQVIRRVFETIAFAPAWPASFITGLVDVRAGGLPSPAPPICPQVLHVDIWSDEPPRYVAPSRTVSIQQVHLKLTDPAAASDEIAVMMFALPGIRSILVWASNDNNAGTVSTVSVWTMRPEVGDNDPPTSSIRLGALLGTLSVPATADGGGRVELVTVDPSAREFAVSIALGGALADHRLTVGVEGVWR
jgi:hypothetical protein